MSEPLTIENETGRIVATHEQHAQRMLIEAQAYVIDCPELAEAAADDLGSIKARIKALTDERMAMTRPLDESKKRIMDLFRRPLELLEQAEGCYKRAIGDWQAKERARLEAERKAQEEAARKAREALEAQQREEQARLQAEADEAAQKAREAAAAGDDDAAAAAAAQAAVKAAEAAVAQDIAHQEVMALEAMTTAVKAEPAKLSGISTREEWKAEVVDLLSLVKAVAAGEASIELIEANTKEINKRAKALKGEFRAAGVRVYPVPVVSARAK